MTTYSFVTGSPREVEAGLLIVPVFEGPEPGPGAKETRTFEAYVAAKHTGKKGENLLVPKRRGDRFTADAVLLVGVGARDAFDPAAARRALGRVGGTARRFGTVATTFALAFGAKQASEAVQAAAEGLALGTYRFERYRSKKDPHGPLTKDRDRGVLTLGREGGEGRPEERGHHRGRRVLGPRPGEHARGRHVAGHDRAGGPEDGPSGGPDLQGLDRGATQAGRVRRDPRRGAGVGEPAAHDRAHLHRRGQEQARRARRARGSRSTPAACRSSRPRGWSR